MPYKNPEKRREYGRDWARRNTTHSHDQRYRERNRLHVIKRKEERGNLCVDCGRVFPFYVLDFDHRSDESKVMALSALAVSKASLARLDAEIAKCDLVCANCHRERTWSRASGCGSPSTEASVESTSESPSSVS